MMSRPRIVSGTLGTAHALLYESSQHNRGKDTKAEDVLRVQESNAALLALITFAFIIPKSVK